MFKNYLYLLRSVHELSHLVKNETILEIYTQEKDKLFMHITHEDSEKFHLIISTHPQLSYITTKSDHSKAKKNTKNFFKEYLTDKILSVSIAENDRIIKIGCDRSELYFLVRGSGTNVILIDRDKKLIPFKKNVKENLTELYEELKNTNFCFTPDTMLIDLELLPYNNFIAKYRFIDKNIKHEIDKRGYQDNNGLKAIINEIISDDIAVCFDEDKGLPVFQPTTFLKSKNSRDANNFDNYFDALNYYLTLQYNRTKEKNIRAELERHIENEIERLSNKLNNLKSRIDDGSKEEVYYKNANLLLNSISKIKKGMKSIELEYYDSGEKIKIDIDEKLTPDQNVKKMFDKAKSERINYEKSKELFIKAKSEYDKLLETKLRLEKTETSSELSPIKKELKIKTKMTHDNTAEKNNFRHFLIDGKYNLFVGKDSKNNDLLTTRFAKQNDLWFHARSVSGSHVVLRVENTKEAVPKSIIKKAASIAAYYSKAKTSKLTPVAYTFKKYVVKKKDLNPGQVFLLREEVIMVPPEIPAGCELIENM